jgi:hypothetical protein
VLTLHRRGLEALTRALLEHETIDGAEAARLIDEANGEPVHPVGTKTVKRSLSREPRRGERGIQGSGRECSRTADACAHAELAAADATRRLAAPPRTVRADGWAASTSQSHSVATTSQGKFRRDARVVSK